MMFEPAFAHPMYPPLPRTNYVFRYIQELGLKDVEMVNLDLAEKQHKAPEFLKVGERGGGTEGGGRGALLEGEGWEWGWGDFECV